MHVTIALCTYNRAATLRRTLSSFLQLLPAEDCTWDVVVVDNASPDETPDVVKELRDRLPLQLIHEPRAGIAHARNAAVAAARGDYILCCDDDVLVDACWMAEYVSAFRKHPEAALFGGPIHPLFEQPVASWMPAVLPHAMGVFGVRKVKEPGPISENKLPWGANFAVRADVARRFTFDARLGHQHRRVMFGEETGVMRAMLTAGHTGRWVPAARVQHVIPRHRQTWHYLASCWRAQGLWYAMVVYNPSRSTDEEWLLFLGRPLRLWKYAIARQAIYCLKRLRYSRVHLVKDFADARRAWGVLEGSRLPARELPGGTPRPLGIPRCTR